MWNSPQPVVDLAEAPVVGCFCVAVETATHKAHNSQAAHSGRAQNKERCRLGRNDGISLVLDRAGGFPIQGGELGGGYAAEVGFGVGGGAFFALLDVGDFFGGGDPLLGGDVVDRGLDALSVALREQAQVFVANLDFGPDAFIEHGAYSATERTISLPYRSTAGISRERLLGFTNDLKEAGLRSVVVDKCGAQARPQTR